MPKILKLIWYGERGMQFRAVWMPDEPPPTFARYQGGLFHTDSDGKGLYYRKRYKQAEIEKGIKNYSELVNADFDVSRIPISSKLTMKRIQKALLCITYNHNKEKPNATI